MRNDCSFEHVMKSTFAEVVYMNINISIQMENHIKFDEAIFQENAPKI